MVKWAWGWTLYSLLPFALLLAATSDDPKFNSTRAFVNVAVLGTIVWYVGTQITFRIGDLTGTCLDDNSSIISGYETRRECRSVYGEWDSFDISGHTFLLSWCLYLSAMELDHFQNFLKSTHSFLVESIVFVIFGWNAVLNLLWIVMLAATQLFFHSFAEKVVAKLMADLFLFAFLYLARRFDSVLPQHKGNDQQTENTESLISDAIG